MEDLGEIPKGINYCKTPDERKKRVDELYKKAIKYLDVIL
jgi:hypothetical protein